MLSELIAFDVFVIRVTKCVEAVVSINAVVFRSGGLAQLERK